MIFNLILYIGIGLIVFGFILFLVAAHFERQAEIKLFKLEQLNICLMNIEERENIQQQQFLD